MTVNSLQQIMEYVVVCLVIASMATLVALGKIDVAIAMSTITMAVGYAFGAVKSNAVIRAITAPTPTSAPTTPASIR